MRTMKGNELEPTCFAKFSLQAMTNFSMTSSSLTFSNFDGNCSNVSEIILMCEHLEKILTISCEHQVELVVFALSYTCKMAKLFSAFLFISLHVSSFLCISPHFSAFHCISLHFSSFLYISLHFSTFLCILHSIF